MEHDCQGTTDRSSVVTHNPSRRVSRRAVVAGTLAGLAGCVGGGSRRGIAGITVYNPRPEPVPVSVTAGEDVETTVAVPANGSVELKTRVVMDQTVEVVVTADGLTGSTQWAVDGSLYVSTEPPEITFTREAEVGTPRILAGDGLVDIVIDSDGRTETSVRVTSEETTRFEQTREFPDDTRTVYHDRLEAGGSAVVTVTGDDQTRESVSLADAVTLLVSIGESVFVDLNRATSPTE